MHPTLKLFLAASLAAVAHAEEARSADAFVDSIGVNTHLSYSNTAYGNFSGVIKPRLAESGIRHIRDGIVNDATQWSRLRELQRDLGVRASLIASPRMQTPAQAVAIVKDLGSAVVAQVEGENEPNLNLGSDWVARTRTHQRDLATRLRADANTQSIPLAGPSPTENTSALGLLTDALDRGNIHTYYGGHHPETGGWGSNGYGSVDWSLSTLAMPVSGTKPVVATEAGYHDAIGQIYSHRGTAASVIATYLPRLFLYHFNRGLVRSYPYELIDEANDPSNPEMCFGLLKSDGTPKASFNAVRNLIHLLQDPGPSFSPGRLDLTWGGNTANLHHTLLQQRDGTFYLAVWLGVSIWDADTRTSIATDVQTITLGVGSGIAAASVCRPQQGTTWNAATLATGTLTMAVDAQVTLIRLTPGGTAVRINFQPATAAAVPGWSIDSGSTFANRNGMAYGWNALNDTTRDRNAAASPDQRRDTLIHLQKEVNPNAQWEVALANGSYLVSVACGDALFYDSRYVLDVEGVRVVDAAPSADQRWIYGTATVVISDGRLTLRSGSGARNNKLCSIEITVVPSAAN